MSENLSDQINRNIVHSEVEGGVSLADLPIGFGVEVRTRNTLYRIRKTGDRQFTIEGNARYCPTPTECRISGSTWGGSMLKMDFIGRGMHMEFVINPFGKLRSSTIQEVCQVP